jgi:membrane protease YdiL (CAAX protease family)
MRRIVSRARGRDECPIVSDVLTSSLPLPIVAAFTVLTLALAALWAARVSTSPRAAHAWIVPGAISLILAMIGGLIDARGLIVLLAFAAACVAANRASGIAVRILTHAIMLAIGAGLFLHVMPGIDNPRVIGDAVLGPGAVPYSKFLNFDKGVAGLCLLGLYAPDRIATDEGARHVPGILWRFAVITATVMALSLALGYVRWDPKLPAWWPLWTWSMVALTALPEEAVFRAVFQTWIARGLDRMDIAIVGAGVLFGIAHLVGGPGYVLLASVAGIGYGWVYASTRSIAAAIATHAGVNTIHFLFFTYPALAHRAVA